MKFGDDRLPERFWSKVQPEPNSGCWLWTGAYNRKTRYGSIKILGTRLMTSSHRFAYEAINGPIAPGLQVDHLCRVRECCNPAHLEAVVPAVNVARSTAPDAARRRHASVTHCPQGHEYNESNTIHWANSRRRHRLCRICATKHKREHMRRKRAKIKETANALQANVR